MYNIRTIKIPWYNLYYPQENKATETHGDNIAKCDYVKQNTECYRLLTGSWQSEPTGLFS